jgi:glycerol-3-phosphate O-acyltransferase
MVEQQQQLVPAPQALPSPQAPAATPTGRYGAFARWLLGHLFRPIAFPPEAVDPLRQLAQRATVVYVLRTSSLLHLLYFNFRLSRLGLPIARAATGLGYRVFAPFARWYLGGEQIKAPRGDTSEAAAVVEAVRQGDSAMVFLRQPRTLPSAVTTLPDPFPGLIELQKQSKKAIALVPLTLLWRKRARQVRRTLRDVVFGDPEEPGAIRAFIGFLLNRKDAVVKVGEPVALDDVVAMQPDADPGKVARRVRGFFHQHLSREIRVVTGPPLKRPERVVEEALRDLQLRRALAEIGRERGVADGSIEKEAAEDLREIAARPRPAALSVMKRLLDFVFNRIYEGVDVDEEGLRRLADAATRAPIVLVPSHKSHIDYLIMSMVMDDHGMQPPLVAAGDNLNFWPVGRFLRMGGAFFIRRSFRGDKVYQATLGAYIKRLLRDGFTQEFFIEGGRSRTGKLLPPKFGMLTYEVEAWITGVRPDVYFAPISISYEKIAEATSYQRELLGGEKQKEDAKALLSATSVLRQRLGRITIRFDTPISLAQLARDRNLDAKTATPDQRRELVKALGWRIAAGINRAAPLAPMGLVSAVLLSHDRRGVSEEEVFARAEFLHQAALDLGARTPAWQIQTSNGLPPPSLRGSGLLERALDALVRDGSVRRQEAGGQRFYSVAEERRMALDYHKNAIVHFLVEPAVLAMALRSFEGQAAPLAELLRRAKDLSRLFKHEFIYEPGRPFEAIVEETLDQLIRGGLAERRGTAASPEIVPTPSGANSLRLLSELLRPFGEGVWLAADALSLLLQGPMDAKEWSRQALDRGRAAYLAGRIRRAESLSKATLENALLLFRDRGVLGPAEGKGAKMALAEPFRTREKLQPLTEEADRFLV